MLKRPTSRRDVLRGAIASTAAVTLVGRAAAQPGAANMHIVLLGDSIFDNGAYVGKGPDVVTQLRRVLPEGSRATLVAIDGAITEGVRTQLLLVPEDATHLVVSAGGNDALHSSPVMDEKTRSVGEALDKLADVRERFMADYTAMLGAVAARGLPTAVCTIYDARFPDKTKTRRGSAGLTLFNDCITREAGARGIAIIDLRLIFNAPEDLANPIEPSVRGGAKIAQAIAEFASEDDRRRARSVVFARAGGAI